MADIFSNVDSIMPYVCKFVILLYTNCKYLFMFKAKADCFNMLRIELISVLTHDFLHPNSFTLGFASTNTLSKLINSYVLC